MPRDDFTPRRTTRLFPGEDSRDIDVIAIARALGERNQHVHGLQSRFGGKAYDITWTSEEEALEAASSGVDILETLRTATSWPTENRRINFCCL